MMTVAEARRILDQKLKRGRPPKEISEKRKLARKILEKVSTKTKLQRKSSSKISMGKGTAKRILAQKLGRGRPRKEVAERRAKARLVLEGITVRRPPKKKSRSPDRKLLCPPKKANLLQFGELNEVAVNCLDYLIQEGHEPGNCLGCGAVGCVLKAEGNKVIKITPDPVEANLAQWLLDQKNPHPAFPRIFDVYRFPEECNLPEFLWVIIKEDISDFSDSFEEAERLSAFVLNDLELLADKGKLRYETVQDIIKHYPGSNQRFASQAAEGYFWAYKHGFILSDLEDKNLGVRKNQLVFRDFGFAKTSTHNVLSRVTALGEDNDPARSVWVGWAKALKKGKAPGL